jgi:hypothetical protein
MDKPEAEKLYDSGKEPTCTKLMEQDDQIKKLKEKIASLSQDSSNSSKPPSSDDRPDGGPHDIGEREHAARLRGFRHRDVGEAA